MCTVDSAVKFLTEKFRGEGRKRGCYIDFWDQQKVLDIRDVECWVREFEELQCDIEDFIDDNNLDDITDRATVVSHFQKLESVFYAQQAVLNFDKFLLKKFDELPLATIELVCENDNELRFDDLKAAKEYYFPSIEEDAYVENPAHYIGCMPFDDYIEDRDAYKREIAEARDLEELADVLNRYSDIFDNGSHYKTVLV